MKKSLIKLMMAMGCFALIGFAANANPYTFVTSSGDSAEADFVTGAGQLTITLKNLQADPGAVIDSLSALSFGISSGTSVSLSSSSGMERTIASDGSFTDGSVVAAGWALSVSGLSVKLDVLAAGGVGPEHTLIGAPGGVNHNYSDANSSVTGNGPHNPFLAGNVTFTLNIVGLTANSTINSVIFQFGTTDGQNTVPSIPNTPPSVPDGGTTIALLGSALVCIYFVRRKIAHA
jgi:hypothetical protein